MTGPVPPFAFRIDGMQQDPAKEPRYDPSCNLWVPPKAKGWNVASQHAPALFYCDGQTASRQSATSWSFRGRPYSTYSMYHYSGIFWVVNYDAIRHQVGDGLHNPRDENENDDNDSDPEAEEDDSGDSYSNAEGDDATPLTDWRRLRFDYWGDVSIASVAGAEDRLRVQRNDQAWVRALLPEGYHAERPESQTSELQRGGLIGDLPIIISLLAYSMPETSVPYRLPEMFRNGRWVFQHGGSLDEHGRTDGRGVIVRVWPNPPHSGDNDLRNYEKGDYGKMFD
ncbi:hypothetical protein B0A49_03443 [Cryomyces minteri]|uniref:Uncharacterized protein n=1 Tax=Cryomyces minteri TaxID=331657 RepID=A0A4U0X7U2_9PEZI|nr:hypothetical protein B0A49_03443 [Cryomyces minteri]